MGYFKQQLIAEQVEIGDRLPAPKPASSHVALQHDEYIHALATPWRTFIGWGLIIFALAFGLGLIGGVL